MNSDDNHSTVINDRVVDGAHECNSRHGLDHCRQRYRHRSRRDDGRRPLHPARPGLHDRGCGLPVAFLVGGAVTIFSVYSYAKLGAQYPSRGGAAQFLIRCFGDGVIAGGLNVFQFLGWIIAMALYCAGFAGYIRALLPFETPAWSGQAIGIGLIVAVVLINIVGSKLVARSELFVVTIELVILAVFAVFGLMKADPGRLVDNGDHHWLGVLFAAGLLYVTYEGFGVVTNSAGDMRDPAKELPRAMFLALGIVVVVYVVVSTIVVMMLSLQSMDANQGHVLSEAGAAAMGRVGFVVIGVAALLATASGVNATMFGDANLAYMVAKSGELPKRFHSRSVAGRHRWIARCGGVDRTVRRVLPTVGGGIDGQPGVPDRLRHGERRPFAGVSRHRRQTLAASARRGAERRAVRPAARLHDPHRPGEHVDHAAGRPRAQLPVRDRLPEAHWPHPQNRTAAQPLDAAGPFLVFASPATATALMNVRITESTALHTRTTIIHDQVGVLENERLAL